MHSFQKLAFAKTLSLHPMVYLLLLLALPCAAWSQARVVNATIDTSKTGAPISKNIYGQFLEHGGDIVNTGVWSEMLVDRKFFYPVAAGAPTPPPVMGNAAGNPRSRRTPTRWWAPVGGEDVVRRLNVSKDWVWDHSSRKMPRLPVIRMGDGTLRYRASGIEDFISERERVSSLRAGRR
jgi:hypothetical protein